MLHRLGKARIVKYIGKGRIFRKVYLESCIKRHVPLKKNCTSPSHKFLVLGIWKTITIFTGIVYKDTACLFKMGNGFGRFGRMDAAFDCWNH